MSTSGAADPGPAKPVRLVLVFGGQSAEHDVSCTTAAHVFAEASAANYDVELIGITRDGNFVRADEATAALQRGARELPAALLAAGPPTELIPTLRPTDGRDVVVLPLLHGPLGEDGTVQGMLELADVAYVGAGVLSSALTMDKAKAKELLAAAGIPQTRWITIQEATWNGDVVPLRETLGDVLFVKPANLGSSIGVSRATDKASLTAAIELAFRYDEWVVVEEAVNAREIEFGVLGNREPRISIPGEIVPAADFYDYEDKYVDGNAEIRIPADLPAEAVEQMKDLALQTYRVLRVEGMARADFLYEEGGRGPLLNELNTIPGFTPISMYPKLWEASGLSYGELIDELVDLAIERHQRRSTKRLTS